ncbi:thioredoxin domain-containing protein [Streptomyces sp. XM4193]|nr:thioredoxin domain-containing protein [Streptomyces sp. XM4193]
MVGVLALAAVSLLSDSDSSDSAPSGSGNEAAGEQPEPDAELLALARRDKSDPYARGAADAPVVMIEYSDFQCPFCGKFARDTKPSLVRKYVDEGVLRIEWRQFPIFGKESENAARASWAAGRQGKFWQFHDVAFGEERKKNSGAFSRDGVEQMAKEAGVEDLAKFAEDMKSADATAALREDMNEGYGLGVSSTPAFLVNGTPVLGAQSAEYFEQTVERARKQAERADAPTTPPADEPDSDERDSDERDADEPDAGGAP